MTEKQLRDLVVSTAVKYLGSNELDGSHRKIIDIYNGQKTLPRHYKVTYTDAWCATFVSAVAILCNLTDIMPTECGCGQMVALYQKVGRWEENDAHVPQPGDVIMYDWDDSGKGDTTGWPEHVGIVCEVGDSWMKIIEGNLSNSVKYRQMSKNGRYIRGYCLPDYRSKATESDEPTTPEEVVAPTDKEVRYTMNLRNLKTGCEGEDVKALQILLIGRGYSCGSYGADGEFGSATYAAVRKYQKAKGLTVDGIAGKATVGSLMGV